MGKDTKDSLSTTIDDGGGVTMIYPYIKKIRLSKEIISREHGGL